MNPDSSLSQRVKDCQAQFYACLDIPELSEDDWLEQKLAEFNWWTSGLNADKTDTSSLDHRLRLRLDVKDVVADLLDGLNAALSECEDIYFKGDLSMNQPPTEDYLSPGLAPVENVSRAHSPFSDSEVSHGANRAVSPVSRDEDDLSCDLYEEQRYYIKTNIEVLLRIYTVIKRSGLKFRNKRADDSLVKAEEEYKLLKDQVGEYEALKDERIGEHERFRRFLARIILCRGYQQNLIHRMQRDIAHSTTTQGLVSRDDLLQTKVMIVIRAFFEDKSRLTPVQQRLIEANVIRRNRLSQAGRVRKMKSQGQRKQDNTALKPRTVATPVTQPNLSQTPFEHQTSPEVSQKKKERISQNDAGAQSATALGSNFTIRGAMAAGSKTTKSAVTKMSARIDQLDYPKCPAHDGPFECPLCPEILPEEYTEKKRWRAHVAKDLNPYVCIFENCQYPDELYASSYEWMMHMADHHTVTQWVCQFCSKQPAEHVQQSSVFDELDDWIGHMHKVHHMDPKDPALALRLEASKRSAGIQKVQCPLCQNKLGLTIMDEGGDPSNIICPTGSTEDVGFVQLEQDEHIANHIHEFALQSLPWSIARFNRSNASFCPSNSSTEHEITFEPLPEDHNRSQNQQSWYNAEDALNLMRDAHMELKRFEINVQDSSSLNTIVPRLRAMILGLENRFQGSDISDIGPGFDRLPLILNDIRVELLTDVDSSKKNDIKLLQDSLASHADELEHLSKTMDFKISRDPSAVTENEALDEYRDEIESLLVPSALNNEEFLPVGQISRLVTQREVHSVLPTAPQPLVEYICRDARKLFLTALLLRCNLSKIMELFKEFGLTDDHLPIDDPKSRDGNCQAHRKGKCNHHHALDVFHYWNSSIVSAFYRQQWTFCAPVFDTIHFRQEFRPKCILPFIDEGSDQKDGHFSTVTEVTIHADHHIDGVKGENEGMKVALKKLKPLRSEPGYNVETAWEQEAAALGQISALRHSHLISRTGAFKQGNDYYIMFEWADGGTLREVWESQPFGSTKLHRDHVMCVLEQLTGLAGALSSLHNTNNKTRTAMATSNAASGGKLMAPARSRALLSPPRSDGSYNPPASSPSSHIVPQVLVNPDSSHDEYYSDNPDDSLEKHWRHGDLKPDNILQFKVPDNWLGTLKIADLGLAKQHPFATALKGDNIQQKYLISHYEAPEFITNRNLRIPRSRRYDIWSMGCIIIEFSIWLLYGFSGLQRFYREDARISRDETIYFTVDSSQRTARVSDIAARWIRNILQSEPECNSPESAIKDLIELARDRLLVVTLPKEGMNEDVLGKCRADAGELEDRLNRILTKARDDEQRGGTYLCTGLDRTGVQVPDARKDRRMNFLSPSSAGQTQQSRPPNPEVRPDGRR